MSATRGPVSVVVAATEARGTVAASLAGFAAEVRGRGEVVLVDASRDGTADAAEALGLDGVRILRARPGTLAPELWRDGIAATASPLFVLTTAAMVPGPGWLDALLARLGETGSAAVGGAIAPGERLSPLDRAVYLLRYVHYLAPVSDRVEPPGDHALYVRARLDGLEAVWSGGFWETEVHRALRARGDHTAMAPGAAVTYLGGARPGAVARQRFRHARHYGAQRSARLTTPVRVLRTAAAPAVPWVLANRIARALLDRNVGMSPWAPSVPWLAVLLAAWSAGEAVGTWSQAPGVPPGAGTRLRERVPRVRPRTRAGRASAGHGFADEPVAPGTGRPWTPDRFREVESGGGRRS